LTNGHETGVVLQVKSITLNRDDFIGFVEKLVNAIKDAPDAVFDFSLQSGRESISSHSVESLAKARWPKDVQTVFLYVYSRKNEKSIRVRFHHYFPESNTIEINGLDNDWVSAKARDLEDYLSDRRNINWIFHGTLLPILLSIIVIGYIFYRIEKAILDTWSISETARSNFNAVTLLIGIIVALVCAYNIGKVFPFVFVDDKRHSTLVTVRKILTWAGPFIMGGLALELVIRLILG
jgi:hypothetical protein